MSVVKIKKDNLSGEILEESLPVWLDLGWEVVKEEKPKPAPKYVARFSKGKEEMVLLNEEESSQDVVEDPKEI